MGRHALLGWIQLIPKDVLVDTFERDLQRGHSGDCGLLWNTF
jgi:hypothetical protein